MSIRIHIDVSQLDAELRRLEALPGHEGIAALEATLMAAFQATQQDTHVITGSLRNSGRTESDVQGDEWEGSIIYGGASPGFPNDPVEYAIYEKARGGDHDFLGSTHLFNETFAADVEQALGGGL